MFSLFSFPMFPKIMMKFSFFLIVVYQSYFMCVADVFCKGHPFQIINTIIFFVSINMVYSRLIFQVFNEFHSY